MKAFIRHLLHATMVSLVLLFASPASATRPIEVPVPSILQVPVGGTWAAPPLPDLPTRPTPMPYLVG